MLFLWYVTINIVEIDGRYEKTSFDVQKNSQCSICIVIRWESLWIVDCLTIQFLILFT